MLPALHGQPATRVHSFHVPPSLLADALRSAKWQYIVAMVIFALLALYMMVAAIFIVIKAIKSGANAGLYLQIVLSILSTYGTSGIFEGVASGTLTQACQAHGSSLAFWRWILGTCSPACSSTCEPVVVSGDLVGTDCKRQIAGTCAYERPQRLCVCKSVRANSSDRDCC